MPHSRLPALATLLCGLFSSSLIAVDIDTTGGVTVTAPFKIGENDAVTNVIGAGTLTLNGSGTIGLGDNGPGHTVNMNMTGGLIDILNGVRLQNGGWSNGVWTNNLASVNVASGGTLDVWDGNAVRIDTLSGAGTVTITAAFGVNWAGDRSLVIGVNNGGGAFTGNINGNNSADGGKLFLTKQGTGTQILTGTNTYNGDTTISGGTLQIGNGGTTGSLTASSSIINNASLVFNRSDASTFAGSISGSGTLSKEGAGVLSLSGNQTYSGNTSINGGTLRFVDKAPNGTPSIGIASGATLDFNVSTTPDAGDFANVAFGKSGGTTISGSGTFIKSGAGTLALDGQGGNHAVTFNMTGGLIDIQGGTLRNGGWDGGIWTNNKASMNIASGARFDVWGGNSPTVDALTGAGILDSSSYGGTQTVTVGINNGSGTFSGTFQNSTGSLKLTKEGTGTQTFTGATTFTGGTTVNGGSLIFVDSKSGSSNFVTNAHLEFNVTTGSQQLNGGGITGTGNFVKSGSGTLLLGNAGSPQNIALTGTNSVIDVQGGTLRNEWSNSAWSSNQARLNVASGATFDVWDGTAQFKAITGSGTVNDGWWGSSTVTTGVSNGSGSFSGNLTQGVGSLALAKVGTGTQTLSGASDYNGGTTVNAGTLNVTNTTGSATGSGSVTIASGATLAGTGKVTAGTNNFLYLNGTLQVGDSTLGSPVASSISLTTSGTGSTVTGASSTFLFDLFARGGDLSSTTTAADYIRLFGTMDSSLGGTLFISNPNALGGFASGDMWRLFDLTGGGSISNDFSLNYSSLSLGSGLTGSFDRTSGIFSIVTSVPEPSRAILLMLGVTTLTIRRRRTASF